MHFRKTKSKKRGLFIAGMVLIFLAGCNKKSPADTTEYSVEETQTECQIETEYQTQTECQTETESQTEKESLVYFETIPFTHEFSTMEPVTDSELNPDLEEGFSPKFVSLSIPVNKEFFISYLPGIEDTKLYDVLKLGDVFFIIGNDFISIRYQTFLFPVTMKLFTWEITDHAVYIDYQSALTFLETFLGKEKIEEICKEWFLDFSYESLKKDPVLCIKKDEEILTYFQGDLFSKILSDFYEKADILDTTIQDNKTKKRFMFSSQNLTIFVEAVLLNIKEEDIDEGLLLLKKLHEVLTSFSESLGTNEETLAMWNQGFLERYNKNKELLLNIKPLLENVKLELKSEDYPLVHDMIKTYMEPFGNSGAVLEIEKE